MWPSLDIAVPALCIGLLGNISFAMLVAFFRATFFVVWGVILCVVLLSISGLFYIIGGQYLLGKTLKNVQISGYEGGFEAYKFVILPVIIGVVSGIGSGTRW